MKKNSTSLSSNEFGLLLALAATLFGGWMRLLPPFLAGFPINDGGLFYTIIETIQENNYYWPSVIRYNGLAIPFTYPPFAFYIVAIFGDALHISTLEIVRWLPAAVTILTIPAFFSLAKAILKSVFQAGMATLFFALAPRSIAWLVMGGGVTRSFGELFLILAAHSLYRLFTEQNHKHLYFSGLFCALTVLAHPEATLHTIGIGIFFWAALERNKQGFLKMLGVGSIVILATLAWWGPMIAAYGLHPFVSAARTGLYGPFGLANLLLLVFPNEPFMTFIAVFAVIGFAFAAVQKDFFLALWIVLQFIIEPRNAPNVAIIPLVMLSAIAFCEVVLPGIQKAALSFSTANTLDRTENRIRFGTVLFLSIHLLIGMAYFDARLAGLTLTAANRQAFEWVSANTPAHSRFLILTGQPDLFSDETSEWFPALTGRVSVATIQGQEWIAGTDFAVLMDQLPQLQSCVYSPDPLGCIKPIKDKLGIKFDYVYISRHPENIAFSNPGENAPRGDALIMQIEQRPAEYEKIFRTDEVAIYKIKP